MEPFIHLLQYPFVICMECGLACIADEVVTHLRTKHRHLTATQRCIVKEAVQAIPGIIHNQQELQSFELPSYAIKAIPHIAVFKDGLQCNKCRHIRRTAKGMQEHCRQQHGWVNRRGRGGDTKKKASQQWDTPWTSGIWCQRFFKSRAASGWFEVDRGAESEAADGAETKTETAEQWIMRAHKEQAARFEGKQHQLIRAGDDKAEPNQWLDRTRWDTHLKGLDAVRLQGLIGPIQDDEPVLQCMWESMERVMDAAQAVALRTGLAVLFEINRREAHIKPHKPFNSRLEDDTWTRYKTVFRKLLCFIQRAEERDDDDRPPYELTEKQGDLFDAFYDAAKARAGGAQRDRKPSSIDRLALDAMVAMADHAFQHSEYENALISGLAVMGLRNDGGWVSALDYTPVYSAVIKVMRMLVLYQSIQEREDEVQRLRHSMDADAARAKATSLFRIVRQKVRRFMTTVTDRTEPGPMDWIFETRAYGMKIRYTTAAAPTVDWVGDQVIYQKIRFSMGALEDMLHGVIDGGRAVMGELLMVEELDRAPAIAWERIEDDHSEDRVGYSFLQDRRNMWLEKGRGWVQRQILQRRDRQTEWVSVGRDGGAPYREAAVQKYGRLVEQFREVLLVAMHMLGGMPARSWELLDIRHANTARGGVRNVMVDRGMVVFVTLYHKNYRSTGNVKVIHRYLPREVGELLVWYLWLVLPFWQEVQGMVTGADETSAFLWADKVVVVRRGEEEEEEEEEAEARSDEAAGLGKVPVQREAAREHTWTADRMRRVLQQQSGRHLGARVGIRAWRHIAVAISNRYLSKAFGEGGDDVDEDDEGVADDIADLQAGHSTHVAGMVYARELEQGQFGTAAQRDGFRRVSRQWHRFLGLGADDRAAAGPGAGGKRKREVFESMREETRFRRFAQLQQVDIAGRLRQMLGGEAQFRGSQERVIRAIVRGATPVVQVAGTGGGKSMSFMLPAYSSPHGVTVVVVPLVALREDLHERCKQAGIDSHVWQSRGSNRGASIVFVTPESAVTMGFRAFVNRLLARGALDRVVVDECHAVLDSDRTFRPQMRELGEAVQGFGVQTVFLTATLAPTDMGAFYASMGLYGQHVALFRDRTTRRNVGYRVQEVKSIGEADKEVCRVVQEGLKRYRSGKVIVYGGVIERVQRLGRMLSCGIYYGQVDTAEGKAQRLRAWAEGGGAGRVMVTTNALGLGIDVPDVRLVVHAGAPRQLRDYAQESGRAGRDGERSGAVIVEVADRQKHGPARRVTEWFDTGMEEFLGPGCRRVVLDRVMDGWDGRGGCEEGEEECDWCAGQRGAEEAEAGRGVTVEQYMQSRDKANAAERLLAGRKQQEGAEVARLERELSAWGAGCVLCRAYRHAGADGHLVNRCTRYGTEEWHMVVRRMDTVKREMFKRRRFERFSGCFWCGVPQGLCNRWRVEDEDGGQFRAVAGGKCQHDGSLVAMFVGLGIRVGERAGEVACKRMGFEGDKQGAQWYTWLGGRVQWGGMESNRMCQLSMCLAEMEGVDKV